MCAKVFYVFCHRDARSLFHSFIILELVLDIYRIQSKENCISAFALEKCLVMCGKV